MKIFLCLLHHRLNRCEKEDKMIYEPYYNNKGLTLLDLSL